jgi:chorismate synthase
MLRYLTAGESHGRAVISILEGMPAGLKVEESFINAQLQRRKKGFGRGTRMQIENDRCQVLSGLKGKITLGSPVTLMVQNKDHKIDVLHRVLCPRPGHADLSGLLKYGFTDIREVLERASARSTVATVALGAVFRLLLKEFGIEIVSRVLSVGGEITPARMNAKIRQAIETRDTVGGIFSLEARGVPAGLGSYVQPDRRLDSLIASSVMSIPGIKGVEIGLGFGFGCAFGSQVHDPIVHVKGKGYRRRSNNAGGIEGGISNGETITVRGCMKPIATLMAPLDSVNIETGRSAKANTERSDTCVVEAAGVVAESALAFVLAQALLEKFGQDNLSDIKQAYRRYLQRIK